MTVLKHNPEVVVLEVGAVVFDYVLVFAEPKNLDLFLDGFYLRLTGGR